MRSPDIVRERPNFKRRFIEKFNRKTANVAAATIVALGSTGLVCVLDACGSSVPTISADTLSAFPDKAPTGTFIVGPINNGNLTIFPHPYTEKINNKTYYINGLIKTPMLVPKDQQPLLKKEINAGITIYAQGYLKNDELIVDFVNPSS